MGAPGGANPSRKPSTTVLLAVVAGVIASIAGWKIARDREDAIFEASFRRRAQERALSIENQFNEAVVVVESLAAFHSASPAPTRLQFERYARPMLERHTGIRALGFNPVIASTERDAFESRVRAVDFGDFRITERGPDGALVAAGDRPTYVAVRYIEPMAGNEAALGFDISSEPVRSAALHRAACSGRAAVTGRLSLVQETEQQYGVLICHPLYRDGLPLDRETERIDALRGYAVGVIRVPDVVEHALRPLERLGIDVELRDGYATPERSVLLAGSEPASPLTEEAVFRLAGREWIVACTPTASYRGTARTILPLGILGIGFFGTLIFTAYVLRLTTFNRRLAHEVDERRGVEEKLRIRERAMASSSNGVLIVDARADDRPIVYANAAVEQLTGYTMPEILGRNCRFLQGDDRTQDGAKRLRQAIAAGCEERVVLRNYRKDGTLFYNEVFISPVVDADGVLTHFVGISNDVTERIRSEAAMRESEERYRTLVEHAPEAITVLDLEAGHFVDVNDNALSLFACDRAALLKLTPADVSPAMQPDGRKSSDAAREYIERAVAGETPVFEWTHRDLHGRDVPCEIRLVRLPASDRCLIRGSITDISARKRIERRQRLMFAELDHRVKNNLTAVLSLVDQTLAASSDLESFRETFSGRIRAMVRTHQALAQAKWDGVLVAEVVRLALEPYRRIDRRNIVFSGPDVMLPAEASAPFTLTIHELTTNALKHGALSVAEGELEVTWSVESGRRLQLRWRESNGPLVRPASGGGLGKALIEGFIEFELHGVVEFHHDPSGLVCEIEIPIDPGAEPPSRIETKPDPITTQTSF